MIRSGGSTFGADGGRPRVEELLVLASLLVGEEPAGAQHQAADLLVEVSAPLLTG
ncbi:MULTISPECIES: hypothetical protein [unclassified Streptomyces]|uniref:hypothetical protein n=1 Tax=unclassified Streptomyces TaxID=2593676 RepID=UPI002E1772EA|nr:MULTISPECIES: hypothetical protein [unclassified Streptomyces]